MKRPNKIYPNPGDNEFGTISDVLVDVEEDMKKIQEEANVEITQVYRDVDKLIKLPEKKTQKYVRKLNISTCSNNYLLLFCNVRCNSWD